MSDNKTEAWEKNSQSTKYNLPEKCPTCRSMLKATYVYVGIYPYIHADFTLECLGEPAHRFNFCFPYNRDMTFGYMVFDDGEPVKPPTDRKCPFHGAKLEAIRLYGNSVFRDGTRKLQLRCPVCFYSERLAL